MFDMYIVIVMTSVSPPARRARRSFKFECIQKSTVESTCRGSRVNSRVKSTVFCFFHFCKQKMEHNNNIVRASNEMLYQSSCVSTLQI